MLQKLLVFLKENSAKILIKYDGERSVKKYTIRLLYSDIRHKSAGKDTDLPCDILKEIFVEKNIFGVDEIQNYFDNTLNHGINTLKNKFGSESVISVIIEERDNSILYTLHIQDAKGTRYLSDTNYKQACEMLILENT